MSAPSAPKKIERGTITKKGIAADHPTWCPGCGDFAVLAAFFKTLEKLQFPQEKIVTLAGIGCSSRFPYFVNTHGGHFIHGRSLPFATGVSLGRDDLHVFVFGGDGDGFSIGGNHLDHAGRKNIRLTYVIMDNFVYGLTKMQTSPTSPQGFKSKTDPMGAIDRPTNPMRKLLSSGATFVGRTHATQIKHMMAMYERAINHDGFSVVECLSECVEFYKGAFDAAIPRKGGAFEVIDEEEHDVTNMASALALAEEEWPGKFGVYYQKKEPTKNELEQANIEKARIKSKGASDLDLLKATFAAMK
ncbi:MAG: pyruvate ferredoxin oxidoreductase [Opitutales bacterium]|jgi:2-oxoglutarate ferredoxin oxidoreductase subunit beta|nr:pyruvate ferredoxin oxidoreductase [Opitutales bacterium]MDG2254897.1 thiamine pyrophosphate-dependent enzyme [Opitutaceae bacterium]MBT5169252.1 pyruvate ferredoxin oxidoreductase [Opitutales bacterium]MBT5815827.1 pyruvate ferredoxin oxidoreductase [Opitutales bacterium]MBT6768843.1 pyruvate ferredoxin oxidoreductase [Opitutales bacterium]